jgi:hypothetical protein
LKTTSTGSSIPHVAPIRQIAWFGPSAYHQISEPNRETALIGAIVLEDLDLLVDCTAQRVVPRDPRGAIYEIE